MVAIFCQFSASYTVYANGIFLKFSLKEKEKRLEKLKREQIILEAKFEELANSNQVGRDRVKMYTDFDN